MIRIQSGLTAWIVTGLKISKVLKLERNIEIIKKTNIFFFAKMWTCAFQVTLIAKISWGKTKSKKIEMIDFFHIASNFQNIY